MALKKGHVTDGRNRPRASAAKSLLGLASFTGAEISALYALTAKSLLGGVEGFADFAAARRWRRLHHAAAAQKVNGVKASQSRS